jgi:hypothetical protein
VCLWNGARGGTVMSRQPPFHDPFIYGRRPATFSAWAMAIAFATVAMVSFAIDQALILSPTAEEQSQTNPPSLLHPVQLIEALIDAASE